MPHQRHRVEMAYDLMEHYAPGETGDLSPDLEDLRAAAGVEEGVRMRAEMRVRADREQQR
jgi:hypothetical protein